MTDGKNQSNGLIIETPKEKEKKQLSPAGALLLEIIKRRFWESIENRNSNVSNLPVDPDAHKNQNNGQDDIDNKRRL